MEHSKAYQANEEIHGSNTNDVDTLRLTKSSKPDRTKKVNDPGFWAPKRRKEHPKHVVSPNKAKKRERAAPRVCFPSGLHQAILVRDSERRGEDGERRSKGYGFIAFKEGCDGVMGSVFPNKGT